VRIESCPNDLAGGALPMMSNVPPVADEVPVWLAGDDSGGGDSVVEWLPAPFGVDAEAI